MKRAKAKTKTPTATPKMSAEAEKSFLQSLIKASGNELASLMSEETLSNTTEWLDTGSYALNGLLSADIMKGIPNNKVIAFAGEESVGKTYFALNLAKNAIDNGYSILYFDSENSTEKDMVVKRAIDPSKISYYPVDTVEDFRDQVVKILNAFNNLDEKARPKLLIILDSIGNLSTRKEIKDIETGNDKKDMTRAAVVKSVFRVLNLKLATAKIPMIVNAHVYADVGSFVPRKVLSSGSGLKYAASLIIFISKSKAKDKNGNVTGSFLTCRTVKNRFCKDNTSVKLYLDYKKGLHPFYGLEEFGSPILKKERGGWSINDELISEKELWSTKWSDDLLKMCNENINKRFAFGDANLPSEDTDLSETEETEERDD